jgi:phage baseplate assembly protein V
VNTGGVTYKQGLIAEAKPGFARVRFDDIDALVTNWLPVIHHKTQDDKMIWTLDVGEQVACLMDGYMEDGCIVGAIYSDIDAPPVVSKDKFRVSFKDGGSFEYDRSNGAMTVVCKGSATVSVGGDATIHVAGSALVKAANATVDAICDFLQLCTFHAAALFPGGIGGGGGAGTTIPGTVQAESIKSSSGIDLDGHHHTARGPSAPTSPAQS